MKSLQERHYVLLVYNGMHNYWTTNNNKCSYTFFYFTAISAIHKVITNISVGKNSVCLKTKQHTVK